MCAQGLCKDAKPTKHTQTLTLRKARCDSADAKQAHTDVVVTKGERDGAKQGVVRFWKEWCSNPSGSRPNFFGRQHLTFDKGRAWMPEVERPEFRKDAKPTERSYGKCGSAFRGIVRIFEESMSYQL